MSPASDLYQVIYVCYLCAWLGPPLVASRRDMLCTSGFMDDVILAHKPRQFNVAAQLIKAQPTYSLELGYAVNGA